MSLSTEDAALIARLKENCELLTRGWQETVDYKVPVKYHRGESCPGKDSCECPVVNEERRKYVNRKGLLDQLKEFKDNQDTDREPKAERAAPRVKKVKYHPELQGFFVLDEIISEVFMVVDRALEEAERDRSWASMSAHNVLAALPNQVSYFVESRPDVARTLLKATAKWVATAKRALRITQSEGMFDSTVCGNCGGGLSTHREDGDLVGVRCVGTPTDPPCGETYPMSEWLSIYEGRA